jgi:putative chitinase
MDRKIFFDTVRASLFGGKLTGMQVQALDLMLTMGTRRQWALPWLAYVMATVYWETAKTMRWDIREFGRGKGKAYGKAITVAKGLAVVFYGRGWPQLTWDYNYKKQGKKLGLDLYTKPDLALQLEATARITFGGMADGDFTGKKLVDYLEGANLSFVNARRIVNGTDHAYDIAGIADKFLVALKAAAHVAALPAPKPTPKVNPDSIKNGSAKTVGGGSVVAGGGSGDGWLLAAGVLVALLAIAYLAWRNRRWISVHLSIAADNIRAATRKL